VLTDGLSLDEVVDRLEEIVKERLEKPAGDEAAV